ncbi:hypothetical protein BH10ACI4_BH10ACI4_08200 [soil metagenome]
MKNRNVILITSLSTAIACCGIVLAQSPIVNIDSRRHGNLASAQSYIVQAYGKINDAQRANEDQLGGHAQRAKDLLSQADAELRLAANVANENRR